MLQKGSSTPTGPRARQSARLTGSRQPNRGGIQKRGGAPRVDKDGDLAMSGSDTTLRGAKAARFGRGGAVRGSDKPTRQNTPESLSNRVSTRPPKTGIDPTAIQKAVLRQLGSNADVPKGPKSKPAAMRARESGHGTRSALQEVKIWGLKQSKAATNKDGGKGDLVAFLERKGKNLEAPAREALKITKSHMEGDCFVVFVRAEDVPKVLRINNFSFAGSILKIESSSTDKDSSQERPASETPNTINVLKAFLSRRYDADSKLLDLSQIGADEQLKEIGMFNTTSRESKFFPALMKICDGFFTTPKEKEDAIVSVTLANNALSDITAVTTLAQTFPAIRNLDLSNNQLSDIKALEAWRWKFRKLEFLILSGNPIEVNEPNLKELLMRWYPTMTSFNNTMVRSQVEVQSRDMRKLPLPTLGPSFRDEAAISENFVKQFFPAYDSDRNALIAGYYDGQSTFSLSINTSSPRDPNQSSTSQVANWEPYIKHSRNLERVSHIGPRTSRLHTGTQSIQQCFNSLPATKHPDLLAEPKKWCIECHAIPGLPDVSGQSIKGIGGLMVMTHGEFFELEITSDQPKNARSFDRTFILGPGAGVAGLRVVSDTLVLRAYGGYEAWRPDDMEPAQGIPHPTVTATPQPIPVSALENTSDMSNELLHKEALSLELSKATGMNLQYSALCLEQSEWNLEAAVVMFEQAKGNLPAEAFAKV